MARRVSIGTGAALVALTGLVGLLGLCGAIDVAVGDPRPACLDGSFPSEAHPHRIAVLGDTQKGITGFRNLLARLREESPGRMIHTGDLVSDNDPGHYRLARWALERSGISVPLDVVPGNHDLKGDPERFRKELRELTSIRTERYALVGIEAAFGPPDVHALEERLRRHRDVPILLFMHIPPFDPASESFRPVPGFEATVELIRKYPVRYVFSGHIHQYRRIENNGTVYIANGIGGDYDSWQLDQKVCATIVEFADGKFWDRKVEVAAAHGVVDNVVHLALGHVGELYRRRPGAAWGATVLLLMGWGWLIFRTFWRAGGWRN